jgi:hypothetical protein
VVDFYRQHLYITQEILHSFPGEINDIAGLDEPRLAGKQGGVNNAPSFQGLAYMVPPGIIEELGREYPALTQQVFESLGPFPPHGFD